MTYRLDEAGQANASLDLRLAALTARNFGQGVVQGIEAAGGALTGVGLTARLLRAAQDGYASLTWTVGSVLTLIVYLAPPLVLVLLIAMLGRRWWLRVFPGDR